MAAEQSVVGWLKRVFGAPAPAPAPAAGDAPPQAPISTADTVAPRRPQERRDERPSRRGGGEARSGEGRGGEGGQGGTESRGERGRRGGSGRNRGRGDANDATGTQSAGSSTRQVADLGRNEPRQGEDQMRPTRTPFSPEVDDSGRELPNRDERGGESTRGSRGGERRGPRNGNEGNGGPRAEATPFGLSASDDPVEAQPTLSTTVEMAGESTTAGFGEPRPEGAGRPRRERGGRGGARRNDRGDRTERSESGDRPSDHATTDDTGRTRAAASGDLSAEQGHNSDANDATRAPTLQSDDRPGEVREATQSSEPMARTDGQDDAQDRTNPPANESRGSRRNADRPSRERRPRGERPTAGASDATATSTAKESADGSDALRSDDGSNAAGAMPTDAVQTPANAAETPSLLIAAAEVSTVASSNLHDSETAAIDAVGTPNAKAPSSDSAALPKVAAFALPIDQLANVAEDAGLQWVQSNADRVRSVQQAIASEPAPQRAARERAPTTVPEDGALVLVETRKALPELKLPQE